MDVIQLKKQMVRHMNKCRETKAKMNLESTVWGLGARRNAWRITSKHLPKASTSKTVVYDFLNRKPKLTIIPVTYDWARPLVTRDGPPPYIVWHHAAANSQTPQDIHDYDINTNGWSGFGYHFYVRKDGKCYRGRPEGKMGAHCRGHNDTIGVCAEGNFMNDYMPVAQLNTMKALHYYLHHKYPRARDSRHKDMSGNATACPGTHYPFEAITGCK